MQEQPKQHWSEIKLVDSDGNSIEDAEQHREYMKEFKDTGAIADVFISDENGEYDWNTGPSQNEIDWTGI